MKKFDYGKSVAEIEAILMKVENPDTGVLEAEKLIAKAGSLLDGCYAYLHGEREKILEK